ncbi:hypothetical protein ACFFIS_01060 [Virgibacillus soli]|uniref:Uncharacterized protein n=1 Tax=Paracerasibacillus soli TaxID=480284 RepID=A0ABU5CPN0_9BACI|nr:hypothetical protein [Virgibacillus soli]MDY0408322.1 hypothetical protein [Virgibacillus soli]
MKRTYFKTAFSILFVILLSGCLYPNSELEKNQVPNEVQLDSVQKAIETYKQQNNGLVPIKTKPMETPIYEKYLVDFTTLKESHLINEIPGNAFENGGIYQYTIIDPENKPTVKLIDLRLAEGIRNINVKLEIYRDQHLYPPFAEEVAPGLYTIDYKKMGLDHAPYVRSPFTQENLPIIMDKDGNLFIDYRIDLFDALQKYEHTFKEGDDIREILVHHSPFVPVYSLPYTIDKSGEPIFLN